MKSAEVVMERQASHQRWTVYYEERTKSHEMKAAFNGMLASSLVCLMLLGQHKAPVLLIASAYSAVLGVVAEVTMAQVYLKLLRAPGLTDGNCIVNGWRWQAYTEGVVLERAFATTLLCAGCIARAAPYVTAIFTGLAVAWHYPDDEACTGFV